MIQSLKKKYTELCLKSKLITMTRHGCFCCNKVYRQLLEKRNVCISKMVSPSEGIVSTNLIPTHGHEPHQIYNRSTTNPCHLDVSKSIHSPGCQPINTSTWVSTNQSIHIGVNQSITKTRCQKINQYNDR